MAKAGGPIFTLLCSHRFTLCCYIINSFFRTITKQFGCRNQTNCFTTLSTWHSVFLQAWCEADMKHLRIVDLLCIRAEMHSANIFSADWLSREKPERQHDKFFLFQSDESQNGHCDSVRREVLPFVAHIHYYCHCSPMLTAVRQTPLHQILTRGFTFFCGCTISHIMTNDSKE